MNPFVTAGSSSLGGGRGRRGGIELGGMTCRWGEPVGIGAVLSLKPSWGEKRRTERGKEGGLSGNVDGVDNETGKGSEGKKLL